MNEAHGEAERPPRSEEKERYRRSVLKDDIEALRGNKVAQEALMRLAAYGCDIGALWTVLVLYRHSVAGRPLQETQLGIKIFRRHAVSIARRMASLARKVRIAQDSTPSTEFNSVFQGLERDLNTWICSLKMADRYAQPLSNPRGPLRQERFLVAASTYLRGYTERPCYKEIADILEVLHISLGIDKDIDAENIRRTCERYSSGRDTKVSEAEAKSLFESYENDELAQILRTELLTAVGKSPQKASDAKKTQKLQTGVLPGPKGIE